MISFREYLNNELNKTTDVKVQSTIIHKVEKEKTLDDIIEAANPKIWTAREINGIKYLIYNKKVLNVTDLKKKINVFYTSKGYTNYGFAKLSEPDLVRYTKVKNIIMPMFLSTPDTFLNLDEVVDGLFKNEIKNYEWKLEEY